MLQKLHAPVQVGGNSIELLLGRKPKGHTTVIAGDEENIKDMNVWSKRPSLVPASVQAGYNQDGVTAVQVSEEDGPYEDNQSMDMADLKKELEEAKKEIAGLSQQLSQQQVTQQTMEQVMATPAPINLRLSEDPDVLLNRLNMRCTSNHSENDRPVYDGPGPSHSMDANTAWGDPRNVVFGKPTGGTTGWDANTIAAWNGAGSTQPSSSMTPFDMRANMQAQMSRGSSGSSMPPGPYRGWTNQPPPNMPSSSGLSDPPSPFEYSQHPDMAAWQPRPAAVPFTPAASDFQQAWNRYPGQVTQGPQQQYMPPVEPMNYRRLLDRNVSCNWKYIVDKIICSNDQQASIFLQQKLKVSPAEMKHELIDAIIAQAYPLMINRFGNFLVQRCLEHGTIEQVNAIANTIRGKTLELSMDAFGCHVIQKAFDVVPESYKASMVHELLRQIPQTVVHRYACHVWQKLFELRWSDSPPQIMKYVNDALHTMWHEVALGETGSLVVQNIFENCLDEDKRACIDEVLSHADLIARGQFGNWCIQHICEHGAPADRSRAIEHVLAHSVDYSTDQFASKVVEKCLKVSGPDFLDRYLQKICEGRPDRPRMPLIDSKFRDLEG